MTIQALRVKIGELAFWQLVRDWAADNRYGNVNTADFIAAAERASGQDLDAFFDVAVVHAPAPELGRGALTKRSHAPPTVSASTRRGAARIMSFRRLLPVLIVGLLAVPATASAGITETTMAEETAAAARSAAETARLVPGRIIRTTRSWECRGSLRRYGRLPIKVISNIRNPGNGDAIRLIGCVGDGNPRTVDLILDVNGNRRGLGTAYDAVRIGQNSRGLVVTGDVECGRRHTNPSIHQDIVQALSGRNIIFRNFTSGLPGYGVWTCWGAGGGWYITWANGSIPTNLICDRCRLATYNQNLRIGRSLRSGARNSVFGFHRSYGIFIESGARQPVNRNNRVLRY